MEGFLLLMFASLAALTALLELFKRSNSKEDPADRAFLRFRGNYVLVYALMMGTLFTPTPCMWDSSAAALVAPAVYLGMAVRYQQPRCVQLATGCKVPTSTRSTSTMALNAGT